MRLSSYLSKSGAVSRRRAEVLIAQGLVTLNGRIVTNPATSVIEGDLVLLEGQPISMTSPSDLLYIILHKPVGVLCTLSPGKEKGLCLKDILLIPQRIYPVGRLDRDSSGLLLLTNDGDLTYRLTHPKFHIQKEYLVKLNRVLNTKDYERIARGVMVEGRRVKVWAIRPAAGGRISITIAEGRKHIVRKLMTEVGLKVIELKRMRIGPIHIGKLGIGKWRKLNSKEISLIKSEVSHENISNHSSVNH